MGVRGYCFYIFKAFEFSLLNLLVAFFISIVFRLPIKKVLFFLLKGKDLYQDSIMAVICTYLVYVV